MPGATTDQKVGGAPPLAMRYHDERGAHTDWIDLQLGYRSLNFNYTIDVGNIGFNSVVLTICFPQDPVLFLIALATWVLYVPDPHVGSGSIAEILCLLECVSFTPDSRRSTRSLSSFP